MAVVALLYSCKTPQDITYFQDTTKGTVIGKAEQKDLVISPDDKVSIVVHSRDANLSKLFDIRSTSTSGQSSRGRDVYTVDSDGTIDFPELGRVHIAGKTREDIAKLIKSRLLAEDLVRDPVVLVNFDELYVNVLGEVGHPGRQELTKNGMTILDVIGMAGDVGLNGLRKNVKVMRVEDGSIKTYMIDLTNANNVTTSPVYYVQPKDIVYVEPNDTKKRSTIPSGNAYFTPSFWTSMASFAVSITSMVITLKNKL